MSKVQEMRQWPTAAQLPPAARWAGATTVPSLRSGGAALAVCAQCVSGISLDASKQQEATGPVPSQFGWQHRTWDSTSGLQEENGKSAPRSRLHSNR